MIVALPPFATFKAAEFYIGGNPDTVDTVASSWQQFGEDCDIASSNMTALDSSSFQGTEGERFTDLVHIILPSQVSALGEVHGEVGDAIGSYAEGLYVAHDAMDALVVLAEVDHAAVNAAVARHTAAEASVAAARVASAGVGGVAAPVLVAAEAELQAAKAHYYAMKTVWDSDLEKADQIKEALGEVVRATVNTIDSQARLAFDSKPAEVEEASGFFDELVDDVFEEFEEAVSAVSGTYGRLRELSEDLAFAAGKVTSAAGNAADALLGKARWGDVKKDLEAAVDTFDDNESDSRGDDDVTTAGEPVDVFSGALVDFSCDVFIDGILPIELSRSCSSSRGKEGVFGAQWAWGRPLKSRHISDEMLV